MARYLKLFLLAAVIIIVSNILFDSLTDKHSASFGKSSKEEMTMYQIDRKQEDCINENPATANMINCTAKAYAAWSKEVEKNYLALMQELPGDNKQLLKDSQAEWIKFRDKELKLINHISKNISGSMYQVECAQSRVNLVKDRALGLKEYLGFNYENH